MSRVVSYLRVSTARQGRSGLGLEAQRAAVMAYVGTGHELVAEYVEVESGRRSDRLQLAAAIHRAKVTGAVLALAKLDRLSRNAAFLLTLRDSGVRFLAVDMPDANDMTVGIMAVIAEGERRAISARTRDALAAAKARGRVLGHKPTLAPGAGRGRATARASEMADECARDLMIVIDDIRASGTSGFSAIARELEIRQIRTPRGCSKWQPIQVKRIIQKGIS